MKSGQGFLLVFSITSKTSLQEIISLREEIIRIKDDENIPIVIVGNKLDLEEQRQVERGKAHALSQRWQAPYYESSARTRSTYLTIVPYPSHPPDSDSVLTNLGSERGRGLRRPLQTDAAPGRRLRPLGG